MTESLRDLKIEYGGVAFGNTSGRRIDSRAGKITMERSTDGFRLDFNLLITAASPTAFAAEVATVEEALRKPFQDLKITAGDGDTNAVIYYFTHDGTGTDASLGYDAEASISKNGDEADTAISRLYRVTISLQLPQDQLTSNHREGMRNTTVGVAYSPSRRRTITISGEWTAVGTDTAREQYEDKIAARASAVLTSIGGSSSCWELTDEPITEADDTRDGSSEQGKGNVIRFSRTYQEIIFKEAGADPASGSGAIISGSAVLDNPAIVDQQFSIHTKVMSGAEDANIRRLQDVSINFSAGVAVSAYLGREMKTLYDTEVRPYLLEQALFFLPTGARAIVEETPKYDLANNTLDVTIVLQGMQPQGLPIEGSVTVSDTYGTGWTTVPVWAENNMEKYVYQGPGKRTRNIVVSMRYFEHEMPGGRRNPLPFGGFRPTRRGGYTIKQDTRYTREVIGRSGTSIYYIQRQETFEIEYVNVNGAVGENLDILFEAIGRANAPPPGLAPNVAVDVGMPRG